MTENRSDATATLLQRIAQSDEAGVLEAVQLLTTALFVEEEGASGLDSSVLSQPLEHRADLLALARVVLSVAALEEATAPLVEQSLDGAGQKQLVLGGAEILAIGVAVSMVAKLLFTRGRREKREKIDIERGSDGSEKIVIDRCVSYGSSRALTSAVRTLLNANEQGGDGSDTA
ncbi:hypothetical protein [Streptomyces gobiensis]|uniref:hypothetical protein n=1 Tax=Streptomyces gobiensis TaxID=2875706 RepID=UPI001E3259CB|nr:hypothetical protein [Streptomyces gobiensis]UGY92081.1 hypothetical protein test1122_10335 [Streptomyces gobiensis]